MAVAQTRPEDGKRGTYNAQTSLLSLVGRSVDSCGSNSDPFVVVVLAPSTSSLNGMAAAKLPKHDNRFNV